MAPQPDNRQPQPGDREPPAAPVVAIAGWLLPGLGYWLLGQHKRAIVIGTTILGLFVAGLLIASVRVIDVPGYDRFGNQVRVLPNGRHVDPGSPDYANGSWTLTSGGLIGEVMNKPWFPEQLLAGPIALLGSGMSISLARQGIPVPHARLGEIGTLYAAVAGILNLMTIIDSAQRAAHGQTGEPADDPTPGADAIAAEQEP